MRRRGFTLAEAGVAAALFAFVLAMVFLLFELSGRQGRNSDAMADLAAALELEQALSRDLAAAVREPGSDELFRVSASPHLTVAMYMSVLDPKRDRLLLSPVRWDLIDRPDGAHAMLARTAWDDVSKRVEVRRYAAVQVPVRGAAIGFRLTGRAALLTALLGGARARPSIAVPERITLPVPVAELAWPRLSEGLYEIARKLDDLPAP